MTETQKQTALVLAVVKQGDMTRADSAITQLLARYPNADTSEIEQAYYAIYGLVPACLQFVVTKRPGGPCNDRLFPLM